MFISRYILEVVEEVKVIGRDLKIPSHLALPIEETLKVLPGCQENNLILLVITSLHSRLERDQESKRIRKKLNCQQRIIQSISLMD
jgi:hypothetical protein